MLSGCDTVWPLVCDFALSAFLGAALDAAADADASRTADAVSLCKKGEAVGNAILEYGHINAEHASCITDDILGCNTPTQRISRASAGC